MVLGLKGRKVVVRVIVKATAIRHGFELSECLLVLVTVQEITLNMYR